MGTLLHAFGASLDRCLPELNLSHPDLVREVHRGYLAAGAELIETNTFGADRLTMAQYGLGDDMAQVNTAGVAIAAESRAATGSLAYLAGSIAPPLAGGALGHAVDAVLEQAAALEEAGAEVLVLETFGELELLASALTALRARCGLPIVAQMTFTEEGRSLAGEEPDEAARRLGDLGADVVGANCTLGPRGILAVLERLATASPVPLSIMPNAGPPRFAHGRAEYRPNPDYFARAGLALAAGGAVIVGGCCGTTPAHIAALAEQLASGVPPAAAPPPPAPPKVVSDRRPAVRGVAARFAAGEFVLAAEVVPPPAGEPGRGLEEAARLLAAGADSLVVGRGSPAAMEPLAFAVLLLEQLGIEPLVLAPTADRSLLGLQADLLGAHALGVRSVLCTAGPRTPRGDYPEATDSFDVDPLALVQALAALNDGGGASGTGFLIGALGDPGAADLEAEGERARAALASGASFLVTTPTLEGDRLEQLLSGLPTTRTLLGVAAPTDFAHAEFLHFERPEVTVGVAALARLQRSPAGEGTGRRLVVDLVRRARPRLAGVVVADLIGTDAAGLLADLAAES